MTGYCPNYGNTELEKCSRCGTIHELKYCGNCFHWDRKECIDPGPRQCLITKDIKNPGETCLEWERSDAKGW